MSGSQTVRFEERLEPIHLFQVPSEHLEVDKGIGAVELLARGMSCLVAIDSEEVQNRVQSQSHSVGQAVREFVLMTVYPLSELYKSVNKVATLSFNDILKVTAFLLRQPVCKRTRHF